MNGVWLFLTLPQVCLQFVIFPDHTHYFKALGIWNWLNDSLALLIQAAVRIIIRKYVLKLQFSVNDIDFRQYFETNQKG